MNRVAIFLRKSASANKFRAAILNTLRVPSVDTALLCSGFFQADKYKTGLDFDLMAHRGCKPLNITTIGLYSNFWKSEYVKFVHQLKAKNWCPACFSVEQKRVRGKPWHAKIFIAKQDRQPVVGVIGSSNMTGRAFGVIRQFNHECDVIFWDENNSAINEAIEGAIGGLDRELVGVPDVIVTNYDNLHPANRNIPLRQRLLDLEGEILSLAVDM